jgi:hypothetical protein
MVEQTEREKMLEKVRKLLALAGSNPNENEAQAAANKAQALLAEYNLTLADVEAKKGDEFVIEKDLVTSSYPWRRQIANAVAHLYFCRYFYQSVFNETGKSKVDIHCFAGAPHNVQVAKMMFDYLHRAVDRLAHEGSKKLTKKQQSPYRVSFRTACTARVAQRIYKRIEEAKAGKMKSETTGNTLPALASLYDTLGAQVEKQLNDAIELQHPDEKEQARHNKKQNKNLRRDTLGSIEGDDAGRKISLEQQVGSSSKPAALIGGGE